MSDNIFLIKQSATTSTITPSNNILRSGEVAYTYASGDSAGGDRLFIGAGGNDSANGFATQIHTIGGKYYTDMLSHPKGRIEPNKALIVDSDNKLDTNSGNLDIDLLRFNNNTLVSTSGSLIVGGANSVVSFSSNRLSDVAAPTAGTDAINKAYFEAYNILDVSADVSILGAGNLFPGNQIQIRGGKNTNTTKTDISGGTRVDVHLDSNLLDLASLTVDNIKIDGNTISSTSGNLTIDPSPTGAAGTLVIAGNLQVDGTTTTINSTTLEVDDKNITLASGAQNAVAADSAGIHVEGANANIFYKSGTDTWNFNKNVISPNIDVTGSISSTSFSGQYLGFDSDLGATTTDALPEGTTNLYYTKTRVDSDFDLRISTKTTGDLTEGSNLYYTDGRARAAVSVTDAGGDGSLAYNNSTGVFTYTGPSAAEVRAHLSATGDLSYNSGTGVFSIDIEQVYSKANFDSDLGAANTDQLPEGSTNFYYTESKFNSSLSTKSTSDLSEGSNLYYTTARADSDAKNSISATNGVSYAAATGTVSGITATDTALGVAAFDSIDFLVTAGTVEIATIDCGTY